MIIDVQISGCGNVQMILSEPGFILLIDYQDLNNVHPLLILKSTKSV